MRRVSLVAPVLASVVLVSGCAVLSSSGAVSPPRPGSALEALAALKVAPEDTGAHYRREDWPHWDTGPDGCDTRETVLKRDGRNVRTGAGCKVLSGEWLSAYDGQTFTDPGQLDVDHIVPVREAAQSGASDWSTEEKDRFYNDQGNLIAASAHANRAKGDSDPAKWLPMDQFRCSYVARYIAIKDRYGLSVDRMEHDALDSIQRACR